MWDGITTINLNLMLKQNHDIAKSVMAVIQLIKEEQITLFQQQSICNKQDFTKFTQGYEIRS